MVDINYPNASNISNYRELLEYANNVSQGWYGAGILISFFFIVFFITFFMSKEGEKSFLAAAFSTSLVAIILWAGQIIPFLLVLIPVAILAIAAYIVFSK